MTIAAMMTHARSSATPPMPAADERGRVHAPPEQSLSFQLIQTGVEGAARDRPIDRRFEMVRDGRRVGVVAELEDRQHHRLLEFAQHALAPHEMTWEEDA